MSTKSPADRKIAGEALGARPAPPGRRILVAEDHPVHQQMTRALLEALGHQVAVVADGLAAAEAAGVSAFDVIVMDRHMPLCGGDEAVRRIRAAPGPSQHALIICHSTDTPVGDQAALYDEILEKPATFDAVQALLVRVRQGLGIEAPTGLQADRGDPPSATRAVPDLGGRRAV